MMHIAIVDENPFIARQVKRFLEQAGNRAILWKGSEPKTSLSDGSQPDLVLIGQRKDEDCGWPCFNRWQEAVPDQPLMLYVLDDCSTGCLRLLAKSVGQAESTLGDRRRSADTATTPPSHDNEQQIDQFEKCTGGYEQSCD